MVDPAIETWGSTEVKLAKFNFTWTINNYSFCPQELGQKLVSPKYSTHGYDAGQWTLEIYPNAEKTESKEFIAIYLRLCDSNKPTVEGKFKLSLLNEKREKTNVRIISDVHKFTMGTDDVAWGWLKFVEINHLKDEKNNLLPNDALTINCELSLIEEVISTSGGDENLKIEVPACDLSSDIKTMRNEDDNKFADVTLSVGDKEYKAHKAVLASRSTFFAGMFEHLPPDGDTEDFEITDMEVPILNEILNFIYSDSVNDIDEMLAKKLLLAAARFDLEGLKVICEETLVKSLSVDNAVETLLLAHDSGATRLRSRINDFINENADRVFRTSSFASLFETHPHIIAEIAFERLFLMTKRGESDGTALHEIKEKTSKFTVS